ncbi:VQ motif-containing protein 31-like [Silene latifolia]|uniref:VQ motif-containing protein 31-like n=1 Tax=Silene latifolia TaxID=37657 RepID=UPI003D76DF89
MEMSQKLYASNPLTTFVQVDTETFKDVVQRLTGSSDTTAYSGDDPVAGISNNGVKNTGLKLYERRRYKAKLDIIRPPMNNKQGTEIEQHRFSSNLNTPTKCFSGLSLVESETNGESSSCDLNAREEEKAIKERRFYLHPSPRSKPGFIEGVFNCSPSISTNRQRLMNLPLVCNHRILHTFASLSTIS